jgi:hypothetical protein
MTASASYSLDHLNALLQVHAEVNEGPLNALLRVFLLFEHEHVVIEKLLQFLIRKVDAQLLKPIELLWTTKTR